MKKAFFMVLVIVAVCFLLANADYLAEFMDTFRTGALVPLVIAIALMLARHLVQAASYDAAFDAVGHRTGFWHNVVLIFSLVFINTFCLFSGATGVAFIIDDAHREGLDPGQSTGGALLSQIGYFAAVFVISVIGFLTMWLSGHMNTVFLVGGLMLAGVLVVLSSLFFVGHFKPRMLFRIFLLIERVLNWALGLFHRSMKPGWGRSMAHSFVQTSNLLAKNPKGSVITIAYASVSAILNMACLVAIGYAFGFGHVEALVAAFAVAAISVILSPTPQGVGVVEALITAILTAYGCSVATAAAIALVYRGIMFWIPFCIGAVMLSQSGFFKSKKSNTVKQRHKDIAWVSGTLLFIMGAVNILLVVFPGTLAPYTMIVAWVDVSALFVGIPLVIASAFLMVCSILLIMRFRTAWALCLAWLVLVGGSEFLFKGTWQVGVVSLILFAWLFWKRAAFDRPMSVKAIREEHEAWKAERAKRREERERENSKQGRRRHPAADAGASEAGAGAKAAQETGRIPDAEGSATGRATPGRVAPEGPTAPRTKAAEARTKAAEARSRLSEDAESLRRMASDLFSPDSIDLSDESDVSDWERQAKEGERIMSDYMDSMSESRLEADASR